MTGRLCARCHYRPVPDSPGPAGGRPSLYCSKRCKNAASRKNRAALADDLRRLFGLPGREDDRFTVDELEAMSRRLARLLPAGAMSRYPARRLSR